MKGEHAMKQIEKDDKLVTLAAVGDVALARSEWHLCLAGVKSYLQKADIGFFNCESPYAETGCPGMLPHGAAGHHPRAMPALSEAGFNVCTLANNHTMDWGLDAIVECRERLEALGIAVCGAGRNIMEARKPAIVEKKGVKVAFLGYNSVGPNWSLAEENKPGCAMVRVHTLYEPYDYQPGTRSVGILTRAYREDLIAMEDDIRRAKEQADLVVMTNHWGIHHERAVLADYEFEVGHAAIDAGADLVLGTSTHILKGIEVYKGKVIAHSLANFALETRHISQEEGDRILTLGSLKGMRRKATGHRDLDSNKGIILQCLLSKKKVERVNYVPVALDSDWANPTLLKSDDPGAEETFLYMDAITREAGLNTTYHWDGDHVVVEV